MPVVLRSLMAVITSAAGSISHITIELHIVMAAQSEAAHMLGSADKVHAALQRSAAAVDVDA